MSDATTQSPGDVLIEVNAATITASGGSYLATTITSLPQSGANPPALNHWIARLTEPVPSNDQKGAIGVTGTLAATTAGSDTLLEVHYQNPWPAAAVAVITPYNQPTAGLGLYLASATASYFTIRSATAPTPSTTYVVGFNVLGS